MALLFLNLKITISFKVNWDKLKPINQMFELEQIQAINWVKCQVPPIKWTLLEIMGQLRLSIKNKSNTNSLRICNLITSQLGNQLKFIQTKDQIVQNHLWRIHLLKKAIQIKCLTVIWDLYSLQSIIKTSISRDQDHQEIDPNLQELRKLNKAIRVNSLKGWEVHLQQIIIKCKQMARK